MPMSGSRNNGLELLRFGAALSVVYGHLVWSVTFATNISDIVGPIQLPLIPKDTHSLWQFQHVYGMLTHEGHITVVGIAIFFLITGWLTPDMMERYRRKAYLINRFFRIMPLLIFATLLSAAIVTSIGGTMPITWFGIVGTSTTLYKEMKTPILLPVIWTLAIELKFYLLSFVIGKWNIPKLMGVVLGCLVIYFFCIDLGVSFLPLAHDLHFILFILVGISLRFVKNLWTVMPVIVTILAFNLSRLDYALAAIRPLQNFSFSSQLITLIIFFVCLYKSKCISDSIRPWANLTYSVYLLHLVPGFAIIALLRENTSPVVAVSVATMSILGLSALSYRYIEIPFIAIGKKLAAW